MVQGWFVIQSGYSWTHLRGLGNVTNLLSWAKHHMRTLLSPWVVEESTFLNILKGAFHGVASPRELDCTASHAAMYEGKRVQKVHTQIISKGQMQIGRLYRES